MNNIVSVAKNALEIISDQGAYCPQCNTKQWSPFDKLYTRAYSKCVDCSTVEEIEQNGINIFAIIEAT